MPLPIRMSSTFLALSDRKQMRPPLIFPSSGAKTKAPPASMMKHYLS